MSWLKLPSHSAVSQQTRWGNNLAWMYFPPMICFLLGSVLQFGHANTSFVKIKGWQRPRGLMLLLKNRFVKLCTSEAISSERTNCNSVVWSSLCMFRCPESSQELQDHPARLAGVALSPLRPCLVNGTSWERSPWKVSASSSWWLCCRSSPLSWGFSVCQCHARDWEQGWDLSSGLCQT